jgi:hypothetical protein
MGRALAIAGSVRIAGNIHVKATPEGDLDLYIKISF